MTTDFFVKYGLYDTTASQDAKESSETNAVFGNIGLLKSRNCPPDYATLEHNFFALDGSLHEMPDHPTDIPFFSSVQSGADGIFAKQPVIQIDFTENHTSVGLTFCFSETYPLEMEVTWYDLSGTYKSRQRFFPDKLDYFAQNQVEEYGRIEIRFIRALPWRNVKLNYIEYGTTYIWGPEVIKNAKLVNDTDPISNQIKTDKLTFDFVDPDDTFNIGNPNGLHKTLQKKQKMLPYEIVGGVEMPLGVFFMDSNSTTKNVSKISAIDYKGMLANVDFKDGRIYAGEPAGSVIDEIMRAAGIVDYTVDNEVANMPLYGTLKIQSCQKALREVLFACAAISNTSRKSGIEIRKANRRTSVTIPRSRKFSTSLKTDPYVSDVNVKYKTWVLDETESEITKGTYGPGVHTIQLTNPAANMSASAGRIVKQMPYYVVLEIAEDTRTEVTIVGRKYVGEELAVLSSIEYIKSGEVRSTKTFTGTLLNYESAQRVADNILDYYQLQQIIQTRHLAAEEKAGDWAEVENTLQAHGNFVAWIESISIDLVGGFIGTAKYRGYYKLTTEEYYSGELYADEEVGIF